MRRDSIGLSPRVRGNRHGASGVWRDTGSIPACAGEPQESVSSRASSTVYPRVCGGTKPSICSPWMSEGLSPRVRGNRSMSTPSWAPTRSIPACAGEPAQAVDEQGQEWVYPRVCGGTRRAEGRFAFRVGLSPRVRGNRYAPVRQRHHRGSIPACAGEPGRTGCRCHWPAVYPRVCGGTSSA